MTGRGYRLEEFDNQIEATLHESREEVLEMVEEGNDPEDVGLLALVCKIQGGSLKELRELMEEKNEQ